MKTFIVGGYVRDFLLNREVDDRDWVVVDSNHQDMLARGFQQVGKSFPVYLHPESREEYALTRREKKVSSGHKGFTFDTESVPLEDDLKRRDITINAMALDDNNNIIDYYGGQSDLQNRILRHISSDFRDDPLRVLRVARFAAQLSEWNFSVAKETIEIMSIMSKSGELLTLSTERVLQETQRALASKEPSKYFWVLKEVGALEVLYPELYALFGVPQTPKYHPEIDSGVHVLMVIDKAAYLQGDDDVRFAALCHDYGKALTPKSEWPSHKLHEHRGVPVVKAFCKRMKVSRQTERVALLACKYHLLAHQLFEMTAKGITKLLYNLDAWRRPETVYKFILVCEADSLGRKNFENTKFHQKDYLLFILGFLQNNPLKIEESLTKEDIADWILSERRKLVKEASEIWLKNNAILVDEQKL